ncbi:sulfate/molybdate ABC transporter ATP-binding protein [Mucilaginibacter aquatilis]|uniref:ATP-binding cassette domain-containing protein n=1 Tax=Mucilaginibacter aquatilis TaxID=1517760 RepID=A0A6I4IR61_9SPHI|nr:ATP-binding cassette domain-containing protein [Mucilaginibacter aquatilis]MVN92304.1 ATP-binding cassette domain-containing protein [Mucilaginibacter aquatilis]
MISINIQKQLHMAQGMGMLNINVQISSKSFTAVYGPSGAGKTSLLRMIAGLMQPQQGSIEVDGVTWFNSVTKINHTPQNRDIGFVFQDNALFPNMTVEENLLYALPKYADKSRIYRLLDMVGLQSLVRQRPEFLSGGQKQRVALARALVRQPKVLLLDEPLSAVDDLTRVSLQNNLQQLHHELGLTTIMVSHNVPEIFKLADNVIHLDNGLVKQNETPARVFNILNAQHGLTLLGEVVQVNNSEIFILADGNIIKVKQALQTAHLSIGSKVSIHAADLSLKKLS